ncbi:MAG: peptidoglycan binding domain-containing protein, partial [Chloroflexota bacterium]
MRGLMDSSGLSAHTDYTPYGERITYGPGHARTSLGYHGEMTDGHGMVYMRPLPTQTRRLHTFTAKWNAFRVYCDCRDDSTSSPEPLFSPLSQWRWRGALHELKHDHTVGAQAMPRPRLTEMRQHTTMQNPIPHPQQPPQRIPAPPTRAAQPPVKKSGKKRRKKRGSGRTMTIVAIMVVLFSLATCAAATVGAGVVISAGRIAPNVSAMGVDLSFKTEAQAAEVLRGSMGAVMLTDEGRSWTMAADELGIALDASATAATAADVSLFSAFSQTQVAPVVSVNTESLRGALTQIAPQVELPAQDAGFQLTGGDVQPIPAVVGRVLDVEASVAMMAANPAVVLTDGQFELVMGEVAPAVADASALVEQARTLLASPLTVRGYDPIDDESIVRTIPANEWAAWLTADAGGTRLSLNAGSVASYIEDMVNPTLKSYQTINADEVAQQLSAAVGNLKPAATVRIRQTDKVHTVQAGETITSIAWDY